MGIRAGKRTVQIRDDPDLCRASPSFVRGEHAFEERRSATRFVRVQGYQPGKRRLDAGSSFGVSLGAPGGILEATSARCVSAVMAVCTYPGGACRPFLCAQGLVCATPSLARRLMVSELMARTLAVGSRRPEARERTVDYFRVGPPFPLVTETEVLHGARLEVLHDNVGIREKTPDDLLTLLGAQVDAQISVVAHRQHVENALPGHESLSPRPAALESP